MSLAIRYADLREYVTRVAHVIQLSGPRLVIYGWR